LIDIGFLPVDLDVRDYSGIIFTSENGVKAFSRAGHQPHGIAYCVGDRTGTAANDVGFPVISADGNASDLVTVIAARPKTGRLLHFRGEHARGDIAGSLSTAGYDTDEIIAYRQVAVPLSRDARNALGGERIVILPLFSPRSARLFVADAGNVSAPLKIVAMSAAVARAVSGFNSHTLVVAGAPNARAMLETIKRQKDA
jgi:uroporphyrinogen-III synthase